MNNNVFKIIFLCSFTYAQYQGVDACTEIQDGDLFDFDSEIQPIINNLIGKTLQQALQEVVQEEEIADLREQQHKMMAIHEGELAQLKKLENEDVTSNKVRR